MFGFFKKREEAISETFDAPKVFTNTIGIEFVYIDGGKFTMGRNDGYHEGGDVETPAHDVTVKGFWISQYPVTQEQYVKVTRVNPSYFKNDKVLEETSKRHPVEQVSWYDAKAFVELMNRYEGRQFYALPTEAQWEYVAKAGGNTRFTFGDSEAMLEDYAHYSYNALGRTTPVDALQPNRLGLYSLLGNVWEWCEDDFFANYKGAPIDGSARVITPVTESFKIRRGGSFKTDYLCLRSSFRGYARPDLLSSDTGFRLVINTSLQAL